MDPSDSAADFTVIESTTTSDDLDRSGSPLCESEEKIRATPQVDSFFNFQLVVFQVYSENFMLRNILHPCDRLEVHSFKWSEMDLRSQGRFLRLCLAYLLPMKMKMGLPSKE